MQPAISELPCAYVSKQVLVQNLSYENEFDFHEKEPVGEHIFILMVLLKASFWHRGKR